MNRIKTLALGLSALALSTGGIAAAQSGPTAGTAPPPKAGMERPERPDMDANGDGTISHAESDQAAAAMFTRMDVNKDGKLDAADRDAKRETMRAAMFDRLDTNKDGSIAKAEFLAGKGPERGPGKRPDSAEGAGGHGDHHGKRMAHRGGPGGHRGGGMMMGRMADADKDGTVTRAEFTAAATKHFEAMDTNHDGQVSSDEREAGKPHHKSARAGKDGRNGRDRGAAPADHAQPRPAASPAS